jgi:hypothetical protein
MVVPPPHVSKAIFAGKNAFDEQYDGAADAAALRLRRSFSGRRFRETPPGFPLPPICLSKPTYRPGTLSTPGVNQRAMEPEEARPYCPEQQR